LFLDIGTEVFYMYDFTTKFNVEFDKVVFIYRYGIELFCCICDTEL